MTRGNMAGFLLFGMALVGSAHAQQPGRPDTRTENLQLETTSITGNRELPTVMAIVPWKRAEALDVDGRPVDSLINGALAPVDRIEVRRELRYAAEGSGQP